jgi:hypothetical protein
VLGRHQPIVGNVRSGAKTTLIAERRWISELNIGWGGRIRTCECRYQNPGTDISGQPKAAEICGFRHYK